MKNQVRQKLQKLRQTFCTQAERPATQGNDVVLTHTALQKILGCNILPGHTQDAKMALKTLNDGFNGPLTGEWSAGHFLRFNTIGKNVYSAQASAEAYIAENGVEADSYYRVIRHYDLFSILQRDRDTAPITLTLGILDASDEVYPVAGMIAADLTPAGKGRIQLNSFHVSALGLKAPTRAENKYKCLELVGRWMEDIRQGWALNPKLCRQELIDYAGLRPDPSLHCGQALSNPLAMLWDRKGPTYAHQQAQRTTARLKQIYGSINRKHHQAP